MAGKVTIPKQKIYRARCLPTEVVQFKHICLAPSKYIAGQLPDIVFEMGLVEQLPPVRGKNAEIKNIECQ